jgi:hypothetical protein
VTARNSVNGAVGIYDDTMHLAAADFLDGTFSSQVSRLAYEVAAVNGSLPTDPPCTTTVSTLCGEPLSCWQELP